jgi:two-component system, response regulator, stage 0 sporulation protein F
MIEVLRPTEATPRSAKPRILLAEDDDEMRTLVAGALRADGHDVVEVGDGGRMLVRLARGYLVGSTPYDLLVSDIRMPVCSGLQILESLRLARWPTPAILMTAFGDEQTRARAEVLGAVIFMKPFDMDDLRTAVFHLLGPANKELKGDGRVPCGE